MIEIVNVQPKILRTKELSAFFGKFQALKSISIEIIENEVQALIGPSGCGKSTFIRTLNRLHEEIAGAWVEGAVYIGDENIYLPETDAVDIRRKIGMVFQKPNPFPSMSIYDNVIAGLRLAGVRRKSLLDEVVERSLRHAAKTKII